MLSGNGQGQRGFNFDGSKDCDSDRMIHAALHDADDEVYMLVCGS
jgi:hypothetical protein